MNPAVDTYLDKAKKWQEELAQLRGILLQYELVEEIKWGVPCYTFEGGNVVMLNGFKDYCILSFIKGALLSNDHGLLEKAGENTQSARVLRFTSLQEITEQEPVVKALIKEAIGVEKAGLKVEFKKNDQLDFTGELETVFEDNPAFKTAFMALTPGRQRAYNMHFTSAKQSATRISRIEKVMPRIMDGFGMNDCVCGLSKRMPGCDGSHKELR